MKIYRFVYQGQPVVGVAEGDLVARYDGVDAVHRGTRIDEEARPIASLSLLPPVAPSKIVAIGRNYAEHARELGNEAPSEPIIFLKPPSAVLAPNGTIVRPAQSLRVDFEGELAIVIGGTAPHNPPPHWARGVLRLPLPHHGTPPRPQKK